MSASSEQSPWGAGGRHPGEANGWCPLFWIIAGIAAAALVLSLLTFQDAPPADRSATRTPPPRTGRRRMRGPVLRRLGAVTHPFVDVMTLVPLACGLALIVVLLVYQYRAKRPLLCIRPLGSTLPVSGIVVAMCAAASSISAVALAAVLLTDTFSPVHLGLLQFPEFIAARPPQFCLGWSSVPGLHYLVLGGMLSLIAGSWYFFLTSRPRRWVWRSALDSSDSESAARWHRRVHCRVLAANNALQRVFGSSSCCEASRHLRSGRCWYMWPRPWEGARRRAPGPRCGSASGSRAPARCSRSPFMRSAGYARRRRHWRHGRAARRRRGTRHRFSPESVTRPGRRF